MQTLEELYSEGLLSWDEYKHAKREENMRRRRHEDVERFLEAIWGCPYMG